MLLDLPTLYAVAGLTSLVSGLLHLLPWATGRFGRWAAWWGGGHVAIGAGGIGTLLIHLLSPSGAVAVTNLLLVTGYAMVFHSVRVFAARPDPATPPARWMSSARWIRSAWSMRVIRLALLVAVLSVLLLVVRDPADFRIRIAYLCLLRAGFDAAIAVAAVRLARERRLHNAWLMAALFGATVPLFLWRAWLAATGRIGPTPFGSDATMAAWLAAAGIAIIMFSTFSLLLLDAEDSHRSLIRQACRDSLTGALNRFGLARLRGGLTGRVAVMMIDLDRFKQLNDTQGHAAGDDILRLTARVGNVVLDGRGSLVRTGGDEFLGVMPDLSADAARVAAAEMQRRFAAAIVDRAGTAAGSITLSIGVAEGPADGFERLLHDADAAMYAVKRGRVSRRRQAA